MYKIGKILPVVLVFGVFTAQAAENSGNVNQAPSGTEQAASKDTGKKVSSQKDAVAKKTADKGLLTKGQESVAAAFKTVRETVESCAKSVKNAGTNYKFVQKHTSVHYGIQAAKIVAAAAVVYGTYKAAQYAYSKYYKNNKTRVAVAN